MENLYEILEVSTKASKEIIDKAYKTLAKRYHPDLQKEEDKQKAEEMMKKLNEAYSILSDDVKRKEYDLKLEEVIEENRRKESQIYNQNNEENYKQDNLQNYKSDYSQNYIRRDDIEENINDNIDENWRYEFSKLSKKEQKKVLKRIEKEAKGEYAKRYEEYFRSLGIKISHKWTLKDVGIILIVIICLVAIFSILWLIPPTKEWLINIYNSNLIIKIIVNIIIGIFKGIARFFENIFNL